MNNNILINNYIEEKPNVKITNPNIRLTNNINSFQNIDEIQIKPSSSNFVELVEQNLNNNNYKRESSKTVNIKHIKEEKIFQSIEKI